MEELAESTDVGCVADVGRIVAGTSHSWQGSLQLADPRREPGTSALGELDVCASPVRADCWPRVSPPGVDAAVRVADASGGCARDEGGPLRSGRERRPL